MGQDTMIWGETGKEMLRIPAGTFLFGAALEERELAEYWIDRTPVTNAEYQRFLNAVPGYPVPLAGEAWTQPYAWDAQGRTYPPDKADHPVVLVTWEDAAAYAAWARARLPREAEWEKAARGGASGRRFPWNDSDAIQHSRANYNSCPSCSYDTSQTTKFHPAHEAGNIPYTSPVSLFAANGYGLYDMAGNVFEWCWDWYSSSYYNRSPPSDPRGPPTGEIRVFRGGCWNSPAEQCRVSHRAAYAAPGNSGFGLGFRTVRMIPQADIRK